MAGFADAGHMQPAAGGLGCEDEFRSLAAGSKVYAVDIRAETLFGRGKEHLDRLYAFLLYHIFDLLSSIRASTLSIVGSDGMAP